YSGRGYGDGGGIYNDGTLAISNSTFSGNSASGYSVWIVGISLGGGIYNNGTLTLNNSTISGNSVTFGVYIFGYGGGILTSGGLNTRNTIIAGNTAGTGPDISGNLGSLGHNLIGNTTGGGGFDATDLLNVNPLLGPLQNNGGPTKTRALLP